MDKLNLSNGAYKVVEFVVKTHGVQNVGHFTLAFIVASLVVNELLPFRVPCLNYAAFESRVWLAVFSFLVYTDDSSMFSGVTSFVGKASRLETVLGWQETCSIVFTVTLASQALTVLINYVAILWLGTSRRRCFNGADGIVAALRVIADHYFPANEPIGIMPGLNVPGGYVLWVELLLLSNSAAQQNFELMLAGLIAGYLFTLGVLRRVSNVILLCFGQNSTLPVDEPQNQAEPPEPFPKIAAFVAIVLLLSGKELLPQNALNFIRDARCLAFSEVVQHRSLKNVILAALTPQSFLQLCFTVLNVIAMGYSVENRIGGLRFMLLIVVLTAVTNCVHLALVKVLEISGYAFWSVASKEVAYKCSFGASGVALALKGAHAALLPNGYVLYGIRTPWHWIPGLLIESVTISMIVPEVWPVMHAAGVIVAIAIVVLSHFIA